jgi:hypothetical protein
MPIAAAGKDIEEMEKRLNTKILQGLTLFSLDNVSIPIGGDALCQMIERPTYSLRILGLTKGKDRRNTWSMFGSGTNLRAKDDLTRRQLLVRMDAKTERLELRKFEDNPVERVLADRGLFYFNSTGLENGTRSYPHTRNSTGHDQRRGMKENGVSVAGSGAGTAGINKSGALGYLQELYNDVRQSTSVRMKAAIEALPYEQPRLAVTAIVQGEDFAALLDRAIERSNGVREVKALPQPEQSHSFWSIVSAPRKG